jgi:3-deoxy-manno-octulosonate cytidylyltransferase (CMP-KDO synthetase)
MNILSVIPARMNSSRFPGKPMKKILGIPMIERVYKNVSKSKIIDNIFVATCDLEIHKFILKIGGNSIMTSKKHKRATERTSEALIKIEKKLKKKFDIIVMVQGDEPMITGSMISKVVQPLIKNKKINVSNLMTKVKNKSEFLDVNEPKVVVDKNNYALYFSRCPIPSTWLKFNIGYKQVCAIPFRRNYLEKFNQLKPTSLEILESIDMNRILQSGEKIKMVEIKNYVKSVDTLNDLKEVENLITK